MKNIGRRDFLKIVAASAVSTAIPLPKSKVSGNGYARTFVEGDFAEIEWRILAYSMGYRCVLFTGGRNMGKTYIRNRLDLTKAMYRGDVYVAMSTEEP